MKKNNETKVDGTVYEISYVIVPTLSEDAALEKVNALKESIATLDGSFISEETPYERELAYEMIRVIKNTNTRFNEGYFGWVKFELAPSNISKIEEALKLDEDFIRFLIVKADRDVNIFTKRAPKLEKIEEEKVVQDTLSLPEEKVIE